MDLTAITNLLIPLDYIGFMIVSNNQSKKTTITAMIEEELILYIDESITDDFKEHYCITVRKDKNKIIEMHDLDILNFNKQIMIILATIANKDIKITGEN